MLRFNQYFKTKPAVTALEIPKWDVKTERTALVSVGLIVDDLTIESEAFSVRGGYEVQQGWALGPLKIGWQLVCQLLVPQILDSFFNNHVLFGTPHLVDQVSNKMSAYLCFKYNLFINCYRALVFHQSNPSILGADFALELLVKGFAVWEPLHTYAEWFAVKEACSDV